MRLPRVWFTVQWLMGVVAVVAVLLAGGLMLYRRANFLQLARRHREATEIRFSYAPARDPEKLRRDLARMQAEADAHKQTPQSRRHLDLARKYERAARYPWLPVAPDPPEPK